LCLVGSEALIKLPNMTDEYSRALARVAVGQLAELAGFEAVQASAADILSELMIKQVLALLRASVVLAGH
jgi:hypothetical protein